MLREQQPARMVRLYRFYQFAGILIPSLLLLMHETAREPQMLLGKVLLEKTFTRRGLRSSKVSDKPSMLTPNLKP